mmetsp:Transcript_135308/g.201241  ORF Transcript_135308/g.201241 Transcript_135308/m.201241 type:complete len:203 (-) Transcript_135308:9-617(-)
MTKNTRTKKQVSLACTSCRKSKTACDAKRPCSRCVTKGCGNCCVDAPKKKRMTKQQKLAQCALLNAAKKKNKINKIAPKRSPTPKQFLPLNDFPLINPDSFVDKYSRITTATNPLDIPSETPTMFNEDFFPSDQFRMVFEPDSFDPFCSIIPQTENSSRMDNIYCNYVERTSVDKFGTPSMEELFRTLLKGLDTSNSPSLCC